MRNLVFRHAFAALLALCIVAPVGATDLDAPKPRHKPAHAHPYRKALPGPVLALQVTRGPTCGFVLFPRYPNYANASCRDYDGVLTAYDPRSPTGVGLYTFRAHFELR
jgi:hypothetical protein